MATNVTFFIKIVQDHHIGIGGVFLPDCGPNNHALNVLVHDTSRQGYPPYGNNMCFFRALAHSWSSP